MYHLFKKSRLYRGYPYCGPTSKGRFASYELLSEAIKAQKEFTERNPVGWDIYDSITKVLVST